MEALSLDTTFLIDVQRERARKDIDGAAHRFLRSHPTARLRISTVALGEFVEGVADPETSTRFLESVADILPVDRETAIIYAGVVRRLRREGRLIGANDLWIASTALRHGDALVTRNTSEFARIEGLRVVGY